MPREVVLAYRVLRDNLLTCDGQKFFHVAHQHPAGTAASNVILANRAYRPASTIEEAREELVAAVERQKWEGVAPSRRGPGGADRRRARV